MTGDTDYVPLDELNDLPECRVLAAWEPDGLIRFEVSRDYAEDFLEGVRNDLAVHDGDGLVQILFTVDFPAYCSLTKGLAQLYRADQIASKQVVVSPEEPDIAISVAVNESQIESSMKKNYAALKQFGDGQVYGQQFGISKNSAVILIQQLEAALDGHENPLDAVDRDDSRFDVGGDGHAE